MTSKWPSFITKDLGDTPEDDAEMMRRWQIYDREMRALIATGGVHQDEDGWWVDNATGELIGPDPEIERPLLDDELSRATPFEDALPHIADAIRRGRGRPRVEAPKQAVTLRLDPATVERFKASGDDWRSRMAAALERAKP